MADALDGIDLADELSSSDESDLNGEVVNKRRLRNSVNDDYSKDQVRSPKSGGRR